MNVKNIIKGHVNEVFNINEDISKKRLLVCYRCPLYYNKLGGICNNKLWLNVNTGDVSIEKKSGYERGCGCRLLSKTRLLQEKCPVGKW